MKILSYRIHFLAPAFLGDAAQSGRWRTPPFKAQLRQWWRVAYAAEKNFQVSIEAMRTEEGLLFGNAWLTVGQKAAYTKSLVRLRLERWDDGRESKSSWGRKELAPAEKVWHPDVGKSVGPMLYLGYGPLVVERTHPYPTVLKPNAAIQAGEAAMLTLAVPETHTDPEMAKLAQRNVARIEKALWLMDRYGTAGGRSRNGWGSYRLAPLNGTGAPQLDVPLRDWKECLKLDWPHAIGKDETGPLIWQTATAYSDWKQLMRVLAIVKIGLRTQFVFREPPVPGPEPRHWLSYPVTNHTVRDWGKQMRLPNSLRFKVRAAEGAGNQLVGVIFHAPCLPPPGFGPDKNAIVGTWQGVHALLDELTKPTGERAYTCIASQDRRAQLKPQLDSVRLKRVQE